VKHETASRKFGQQAVAPAPQTAGEIMTTDVISVSIGASVRDVAILLLQKRISAVPVLAADQQLVGMVSEGDLLGRGADDRLARRDWWLTLLKGGQPLAEPLEKLVARPVEDVMHAPVVTIEPLTSSSTRLSLCSASCLNTGPRCRFKSPYSVLRRYFGMKTT